jgi:hypothetical protein
MIYKLNLRPNLYFHSRKYRKIQNGWLIVNPISFLEIINGFFWRFKLFLCKIVQYQMFIDSPLHLGDVGNQMHAKNIGTNKSTPTQIHINEIVHFTSSRGIKCNH